MGRSRAVRRAPMSTTSKLADPVWREERARNAALARTTVSAHIRALAAKLPAFTAEEAADVGRLAAELDARRGGDAT